MRCFTVLLLLLRFNSPCRCKIQLHVRKLQVLFFLFHLDFGHEFYNKIHIVCESEKTRSVFNDNGCFEGIKIFQMENHQNYQMLN